MKRLRMRETAGQRYAAFASYAAFPPQYGAALC